MPMLKRFTDILIATIALVLLAPLFLWVMYKVRKNMGSPIFFVQQRPGLEGKPFDMIKFRSMKNAFDANGNPLPDDQRITPFGKKLRATSLDEMPQLINVIKGDMSIVGPRPQMPEFMDHYTQDEMRRHHVKPGMTGWAQVNGRNHLSWEEKFKLDLEYVDNHSLWLDFKIMFKTVLVILRKEGIDSPEATIGAKRFKRNGLKKHSN